MTDLQIRLKGGWFPSFFMLWLVSDKYDMDRERLKLIVRNMKSLVEALESEVYSDVESYRNSVAFSSPPTDYDEAWDDDDGYPD